MASAFAAAAAPPLKARSTKTSTVIFDMSTLDHSDTKRRKLETGTNEAGGIIRSARAATFEASVADTTHRLQSRWATAFSLGPTMPEVSHHHLRALTIPEIEIDPVGELRSYINEEHVQSGSCILDEGGAQVRWPWQSGGKQSATVAVGSIARLINLGLDKASADGHRGRQTTGVRAWFSHCKDEQTSPNRPLDPVAPLWVKLKEEWLAMRFVCALVLARGVAVTTAAQYFSTVQGWHAREHGVKLCGGLKLERLPQMLKGLKRTIQQLPSKVRRGLAPQALRRAMDLCLSPANPEHANMRAALAVAFQGLLRGEEFAIDPKVQWRSEDRLTRADIVELTSERMVIMMHPCKNMQVLKGKTVPLVIGAGGQFIDAVAEVANMLKVDPANHHSKQSTPLFRIPATNACIAKALVHDTIKHLMTSVGENPDHFGSHSCRIGGATALFARGADPTVIRTMGRWSSDIYRLYVRACFERCCEWTKQAGSAHVTDVVVEFDEVDAY